MMTNSHGDTSVTFQFILELSSSHLETNVKQHVVINLFGQINILILAREIICPVIGKQKVPYE